MGMTNIRLALEKRYSSLTGELREVKHSIARIRREADKLPDLEARIPKLEALIESAAMLLRDADPEWQPDQTPPVKPFTHNIPVPFGSCGRRALAILREADRPMSAREVALEVLRQCGGDTTDLAVVQRTTTNVNACFCKQRGRTLESSGKYPAQWRSIANRALDFDI